MVYNTMHLIHVIQINGTNNKGKKGGGGGEKRRKHNEWKQDKHHHFFRLTFKESFRHVDV